MSDSNSQNYRIECLICKETFLNKDYSRHINLLHLKDIFSDDGNKKELKEACDKKEGGWNDPIELSVKEKMLYYTPCCKKFYTKLSTSQKHRTKKECRDKYVKQCKKLLSDIDDIIVDVSTTFDISGNHNVINNTNNQVINITNYYDTSGNLIKSIIKEASVLIETERLDKVSYFKKLSKLRSIFKDNPEYPEYNSDISDIGSAYDSDDESETTITRMDFKKDFEKYNKIIANQLLEANIDISRKSVGLKTKEDIIKMKEEQEAFEKEQEEEERSETIGNLRGSIKSIKDKINRYTKQHNEYLELMKSENSGITQDIFNKEYSQTNVINNCKKELEEKQKELSKLLSPSVSS